MADKARSVIDTILGEAVSGTRDERFTDMLGIASTIANRAAMTGQTPESIISAPGQYSAYGNKLPSGAKAYRSLAQQAWDRVQTIGPIHEGTYYATPSATKNLPSGLQAIARTTGHQYFADPMARSIRTAKGYVQPTVEAAARVAQNVSRATESVVSAAARGLGLEAAMPSAPLGNKGLAAYSRAGLSPTISSVLDRVAANPNARGITVNSGYRDPARNARVGGAKNSQHIRGNALDLNVRGMTDEQKQSVLDTAVEAGAKGIGIYSSGSTVHVDTRKSPAVWSDNYKGIPVSKAPSWAQPTLTGMMQAGRFAVTPRTTAPVPPTRMTAPVSPVSRAPLSAPKTAQPAAARFAPAPSPAALAASSLATKGTRVTARPSAARMAPSTSLVSAPVSPAGPMAKAQDLGTLTAAGGVPSPVRPDNLAYTGPKGQFSVAPTPAPSMVRIGPNPAVQNVAYRAPNPAPVPAQPARVVPAVAVTPPVNLVNPVKQTRLAPPIQPVQRVAPVRQASVAPAMTISQAPRGPSVRDVYGGTIGTATATDGNKVTRDAYGNIGITNAYGVTSWSSPDGRGISKASLPGGVAQAAKGILGGMAGAAVGSAVAGPIGGLVGGVLGNRAIGGMTQPAAQQNGMGLLGGLFSGLGLGGNASKGNGGSGSRGGSASGSRGGSSRGGSGTSSDRSNSGWGR